MSSPLNKDSRMECKIHGERVPSFICHHLQHGDNLGFYEANDDFDPEWPFEDAWCSECDKVLVAEGEWNDVSEGFAKFLAICEGCYEDIKFRNSSNT